MKSKVMSGYLRDVYNLVYLPLYELVEEIEDTHIYSPDQRPLVKLYLQRNRSFLDACAADETSLTLLEVNLESKLNRFLLVTKPVGPCFELMSSNSSELDSPKGWIWAVVIKVVMLGEEEVAFTTKTFIPKEVCQGKNQNEVKKVLKMRGWLNKFGRF